MKTSLCLLLALAAAAPRLAAQTRTDTPPVAVPPSAAESVWTLDDCIRHAQERNIAVRQRMLAVREQEVQLSTARFSRLPDLSASLGADASFGRVLSSDNTYQDYNQQSGSLGVSASMPLFQGLRINRQIEGGKLDLAAAVQDLERIREDVSVNVLTLYLQVLYAKELVAVAERQAGLSSRQEARSRELVSTGRQPESALYESTALRAKDELTLTQARNDLQLALLALSQALDRESAAGFDVAAPQLDSLAVGSMHRLASPDAVYDHAVQHRPRIRAERLRVESRENAVDIARAALYPTVSLAGGYGTGVYSADKERFWAQMRNNSREYVGLSVQIPIFNRRASRNNIRSARLALQSQELALLEARQTLRKEIEQAYYNAEAAFAKYRSADEALRAARLAFVYEERKAEAGRSTIFDFGEAKTRMERAESELVQAKYEFVFRSKILDYYRGEPLTL